MKYYIYRFLNKDKVIYVGKTSDLKQRMYVHFNKGHLPLECYEKVEKIQYIECINMVDMNIKELYFINKYKPMFNTLLKGGGDELIIAEFEGIEWRNEYELTKHKDVADHYESIIAKLNDEIKKLQHDSTTINLKYIKLIDSSSRDNYLVRKYKEVLDMVHDNSVQAKVRGIEKDPYWKQR